MPSAPAGAQGTLKHEHIAALHARYQHQLGLHHRLRCDNVQYSTASSNILPPCSGWSSNGNQKPAACFTCFVHLLTLKTEAVFSSKMPVNFHWITLRHSSEDRTSKPPNNMTVAKQWTVDRWNKADTALLEVLHWTD
jgi:hypothetical protein